MIKSLGAQIYTVRSLMTDKKSIAEVFATLKSIGYDEIQPAGYYGLSASEYAQLAKDAGLSVCGTICSFDSLKLSPDKIMEEHTTLGTTNIGIGAMPSYALESVDTLLGFIDKLNRVSELYTKDGFSIGYHNHSFEFRKLGGERIMDVLVRETDDNINYILDTYWIQHGGGDVIGWMNKLKNRIKILHLKDMAMEDTQVFAEIGQGNLNFDSIIETAASIGVEHYVVEQDECRGNPVDSLAMSAEYIRNMFMKG